MKKLFIFMTCMSLMSIHMLQAQEKQNLVMEGDVLILNKPIGSEYQHIDFPRKNIIIKRGAIANFNNLVGKKLIVQSVTYNIDGTTKAVLKRKDRLNFFRFYPTVETNVDKALAKGELKMSKNLKKYSLFQQ